MGVQKSLAVSALRLGVLLIILGLGALALGATQHWASAEPAAFGAGFLVLGWGIFRFEDHHRTLALGAVVLAVLVIVINVDGATAAATFLRGQSPPRPVDAIESSVAVLASIAFIGLSIWRMSSRRICA